MKASKKLRKEISNALERAFAQTLEDKEYGEKGGERWFNTPPDFWTQDERHRFDLLMEFKHQFEVRLDNILSNSLTNKHPHI